jgi:hypothetical protein
MSVYATMFMGMSPLGSLLAGTLGHWLGASIAVSIGDALRIFGRLLFAKRLSQLRKVTQQVLWRLKGVVDS